jgi:hypothetical protein
VFFAGVSPNQVFGVPILASAGKAKQWPQRGPGGSGYITRMLNLINVIEVGFSGVLRRKTSAQLMFLDALSL